MSVFFGDNELRCLHDGGLGPRPWDDQAPPRSPRDDKDAGHSPKTVSREQRYPCTVAACENAEHPSAWMVLNCVPPALAC